MTEFGAQQGLIEDFRGIYNDDVQLLGVP